MMFTTLAAFAMTAGTTTPPTIVNLPYINIDRVEQIDNLDQGDMLGADRADFYAEVTVNGVLHKTPVLAKDDGWPNWQIPLDYSTPYSTIHIRLMDDDGGLERQDDHADIDPKANDKDLMFTYDRWTGQITGDVTGMLNRQLISWGDGDDDKARISFTVMKM